jgi:hypothetical protein
MAGDHPRNTIGMREGARGGAKGSGAPMGNQNALKHDRYTREAIAESAVIRALLRKGIVPGMWWDRGCRLLRRLGADSRPFDERDHRPREAHPPSVLY